MNISNVNPTNTAKTGFVFDFDKLFNKEQIDNLNKLIADFETETTIEMAIITFDSIYNSDEEFHVNTLAAGNWLGVGKKESSNGIVVGISKVSGKIRIEVGDCLTNTLTDDDAKQIIDEDFIPYYKEGYFYEGTYEGTKQIIQVIREKLKK